MPQSYSQIWNLDTFFSGGSSSSALLQALKELQNEIAHLRQGIASFSLPSLISSLQKLDEECHELESFIACLLAQNTKDQQAVQLQSQIATLRAAYENVSSQLDEALAHLPEETFRQLITDDRLSALAFCLQEKRTWQKKKIPLNQEKLVHQLWIDGYQGWNDLYGTLIGSMRISVSDPNISSQSSLSIGQAENRLFHPDRTIRQTIFQAWEQAWASQEEIFAQILNHLSGFRLNLYEARGWTSVLAEPLFCNRMQEDTLTAMWESIEAHKGCLQRYLEKKASLQGTEKLAWFDVESPLSTNDLPFIPFQEAAEIIIRQFNRFSPNMGAFAKRAFEEQWIEAEDRPGKRPGGFCTHFPQSRQSRIFMTYSGTMNNVFTLAHELGHAYHNAIIDPLPRFAQHYRMNVAETASTLAEMAVIDAMIEEAQKPEVRKVLLNYKVQRSVLFLMNIHARFLFELRFYEERKKGFVLASTLNHLMEEAQQEAFCQTLSQGHPHFWASKQHFYATDVPFYNFPYTFGYLFSLGLYARLREKGPRAPSIYEDLLFDTGRMTTEELAQKHLQVDLRKPIFWEQALELIEKDIQDILLLI
ncbi:M3 family oligoendopeptidase [Candidatus Protochlamydia phocaeensis]|uniref:M3 family oligoendopeptidase n=1 Tax=Candidatus Protochlamydia phocaeensis TaxID=1414722 RepID=UPI000838F7CB|nr:M3 family oligoendopeptidase [Candidatus Protochlamydia phocaeensis]